MTSGVLLALGSALVWGSADFCGGRASLRRNAIQVMAVAAVSGVAALTATAVALGEPLVGGAAALWSMLAGLAGSFGLVCLYRGLALGHAATAAPTAAVVAAAIPAVFAAVTQGAPARIQGLGFALALAGIWLVARSSPGVPASRASIRLGLLAGLGFGGFLVLIALVDEGAVFVPLAIARATMLAAGLAVLAARGTPMPSVGDPLALTAGVLDAGGNVLYLLARQHVRIDVAAVLSSLYPVSTVVLAFVLSREPVTRMQWSGAVVCLVAVSLIAA
ncbi:MAG: EamA family transporter [Vicinamibacterales bacterium]